MQAVINYCQQEYKTNFIRYRRLWRKRKRATSEQAQTVPATDMPDYWSAATADQPSLPSKEHGTERKGSNMSATATTATARIIARHIVFGRRSLTRSSTVRSPMSGNTRKSSKKCSPPAKTISKTWIANPRKSVCRWHYRILWIRRRSKRIRTMVTTEKRKRESRCSVRIKAGSENSLPWECLYVVSVNLAVEVRISVEKDKSEPVSNRSKVRIIFAWCECS